MVNTSDSGSRGRGSSPTRVAVLCPSAIHIYPPIVLVIPKKRLLHPNMTDEELFTWTLSIKPYQKKQIVKLPLYGRSISVHSIYKEATHLTIPL